MREEGGGKEGGGRKEGGRRSGSKGGKERRESSHILTASHFLCRVSRNEKTGRQGNATSSSGSSSSGPSSRGNSRQHGQALRGQPTGMPMMQVEKDSRGAARGASVATNGGMPSDYQVRGRGRADNVITTPSTQIREVIP